MIGDSDKNVGTSAMVDTTRGLITKPTTEQAIKQTTKQIYEEFGRTYIGEPSLEIPNSVAGNQISLKGGSGEVASQACVAYSAIALRIWNLDFSSPFLAFYG